MKEEYWNIGLEYWIFSNKSINLISSALMENMWRDSVTGKKYETNMKI